MFPDAPEYTVLSVHHNEQKGSEIFCPNTLHILKTF